jgi:hypothetical protein
MFRTAVVAKVIQVAQRELSKPENQRKIREGVSKVQQRLRKKP